MSNSPEFDQAALRLLSDGCSDATVIFLADQLGVNTFVIRTIDDVGSWEGALVDHDGLASYLKETLKLGG